MTRITVVWDSYNLPPLLYAYNNIIKPAGVPVIQKPTQNWQEKKHSEGSDLSQVPKSLARGLKVTHSLQFSQSWLWAFLPIPTEKPTQVYALPSSMVTFPRKKYFPWPLESATPKLCRETEQTLKSRAVTGIDLRANLSFLFYFPFSHFHFMFCKQFSQQFTFRNLTDYSGCWFFLGPSSCFKVISDWKCQRQLAAVVFARFVANSLPLQKALHWMSSQGHTPCSWLPPYTPLFWT